MVLLRPEPAIAPGLIVQFPEGKPVKSTLPDTTVQVGCVIVLTVGTAGVAGCLLIAILAVGKDMHPEAFVTVKL